MWWLGGAQARGPVKQPSARMEPWQVTHENKLLEVADKAFPVLSDAERIVVKEWAHTSEHTSNRSTSPDRLTSSRTRAGRFDSCT